MRQNLSNVVAIDSESTRKLASQAFVPSSVMTFRLPEDTTLRALVLRLSGSIVTTFASGTPVADDFGPFDDLVSTIQVRVGGSDSIKTVTPRMAAFHQLLDAGIRGERKSSSAAAAVTGGDVTADSSAFTYGTTTQVTSVAESLVIFFECPLVKFGRQQTWLNLRGIVGSELILNTKAYSALLGFGNTAPVVYSSSTLQIDVKLIEARTVEQNRKFQVYKETFQTEPFSAAAANRVINLNKGQKIIGLSMLARDGASGSTTTATGLLASDILVDQIKLTLNGSFTPRNETWFELQADNKARFNINAPYSSNKSILQGFAYMDLTQFGVIDSALDARFLDNVQLEISTKSAATYTSVATLLVHQHELVEAK
ncbi:MAG: hypothetical protein AB7K68_17565 [Bacteriovoracia bacterium]